MISDERINILAHSSGLEPCDSELVYDSVKVGEIVSMAKEILSHRACKHHWNALRLTEGNGRYQYCTLCGAKKVAD